MIFVGTGPGDPDLLTLGAIAALADAAAVILDDERQREILGHPAITLGPDAEIATLGLSEAGKPLTPSARAKIILKHAEAGAAGGPAGHRRPVPGQRRGRRGRRLRARRHRLRGRARCLQPDRGAGVRGHRPDPRRRRALRLRRPTGEFSKAPRPLSGAAPRPWWSAPWSTTSPAWSRPPDRPGRPGGRSRAGHPARRQHRAGDHRHHPGRAGRRGEARPRRPEPTRCT